MPRYTPKESGRFSVVVVQHGETSTDYYDDFKSMLGNFFNYGLTNCIVESITDEVGELESSPVHLAQLQASYREGANHWSHRV